MINDVPKSDLSRVCMRRNESAGEFQQAREAAVDKTAFDAARLVENGWTADRERSHQKHSRNCGFMILDGQNLIEAIERATIQKIQDDERREKMRQHVADLAKDVVPTQKPMDQHGDQDYG